MARLDQSVSNGISNVSLWSSRNAKPVVAVVLVLTLLFGYGVTLITTNVDVADVLPRGDPNTEAAQNLTAKFRSTFTQQVTFQLHIDDDGRYWEAGDQQLVYRNENEADRTNITDEVYVRAMEELKLFIQKETAMDDIYGAGTGYERTISIDGIYALINWTAAGGYGVAPDSAYHLPGFENPSEAGLYNVADQAIKNTDILNSVDALAAPDWEHAAMLFMPAADNDRDMRILGESIIAARDKYVEAVDAGDTEWKIWGSHNPPLLTVDLPVANAHSSALVEQDMVKLMPAIAAFIIVSLFIAFRNIRSIAISFTALGVGLVWTYGTMGFLGIALNTLNMTIVPLIMGVGIDYAIHMINEFLEHKSEGHTDAESFQIAGQRAGLAMFIATLTTVLGLVVMILSPSLLMAQMGLLSAVAIASTYVLTITFIPAALTLIGGTEKMGASFTPSKTMPAIARAVTKARFLVLIVVAGLTVGAYFGSLALDEEAFGDPGKNFPEDDPIRIEHEEGLRHFYDLEEPDVKANILTFEGPNILTPDAVQYMRLIEGNLMTKDRVISDTLRTLMFFIETWQIVKGGPACVGIGQTNSEIPGQLEPIFTGLQEGGSPCADQAQFPDTEEELRAEVEMMFDSPMKELASIIINHPTLDMAAMTFSVKAATYDEAVLVWDQVWDAIEDANDQFGGKPPEGVYVAFVGNTATNYLFVAKELPWLTYMSIVASIILFILVLLFTRDIKATILATVLAGITSLWWLGILPLINIGLAITLMLPLVFIFNIGTDYVVHIIWNMKQIGDPREVFSTVGKAILFSAITTAGAFAFFILIQNVAVSRTMVATTLSIFIIFLATMMVIPAFYKVQAKGEPAGGKPPEEDGDAEEDDDRTTFVAVKRVKS